MKTFSVALVVLSVIFTISRVSCDGNTVCQNLNERCTEDNDCCNHNCRRGINIFIKHCKEPIPILELAKIMIGPIGDSTEKSEGPVNKMIGSTIRLFGSVKHSIVKIVFTGNHLFSPRVQDWTCTYLQEAHERIDIHSYLPQSVPPYLQVQLQYKNESAIVSIDNIIKDSLGDILFLPGGVANKLGIISEGPVPCKVIIPWTGLAKQYLVRYLYVIPVVGVIFGFVWGISLL